MSGSTEGFTYCGSDAHGTTSCPMRSSTCVCDGGRLPCPCGKRDVIGEVIAEDSRPMVSPAVSEHAMLESVPALRAAVSERDARIEEQAREIERLTLAASVSAADANDAERELAALKAQSSGVALPDRHSRKEAFECGGVAQEQFVTGWNACLDEVARLNSSPVSAGGVDGRAAFEAELRRDGWGDKALVRSEANGSYEDWSVRSFWKVWQARADLNAGSAVPDEWRDMLTELQWQWEAADHHFNTMSGHYCPSCRNSKDSGHDGNCEIAALLAAAPTAKKEG